MPEIRPKVILLTHTPEPEKVIAAAAKLCYSNSGVEDLYNNLDEASARKFLAMLNDLGHASPTEHASFTFAIEGVSRAFLAQITRHRIASFSVQSQRYVRLEDFNFIIPDKIKNNEKLVNEFLAKMKSDAENYMNMVRMLEEENTKELMDAGMDEKEARKKASKMANEDARAVLPNACETKMIITMNARELMNFFRLRCCNRAQDEIRNVADMMLQQCLEVAPTLFAKAGPSCISGKCSEGKMSCGRTEEVKAKHKLFREYAEAD